MNTTKEFLNSVGCFASDAQAFLKTNKSNLFTTGAVLLVMLNLVIIQGVLNALHSLPLLPSVMELIGVGYSAWFSVRYLYSQTGRSELLSEVARIRAQVFGTEAVIEPTAEPVIQSDKALKFEDPDLQKWYDNRYLPHYLNVKTDGTTNEKEVETELDSPGVLATSVLFEFLEETGWTTPTKEQDAVLDAIISDEAYDAELAKILYERVSATPDVTVYSQALQDWYLARQEEKNNT